LENVEHLLRIFDPNLLAESLSGAVASDGDGSFRCSNLLIHSPLFFRRIIAEGSIFKAIDPKDGLLSRRVLLLVGRASKF
jgi:hypothetical protein